MAKGIFKVTFKKITSLYLRRLIVYGKRPIQQRFKDGFPHCSCVLTGQTFFPRMLTFSQNDFKFGRKNGCLGDLIPIFIKDFLCIHPFNDGSGNAAGFFTGNVCSARNFLLKYGELIITIA